MPRYEYRCRSCQATFELDRPMAQSAAPVACPDGHGDTVKLLSTVALGGRSGGSVRPRRRGLLRRFLRLRLTRHRARDTHHGPDASGRTDDA